MLLHDGRPWLGANFWSRSGGPLMWRSYDTIEAEQHIAPEDATPLPKPLPGEGQ